MLHVHKVYIVLSGMEVSECSEIDIPIDFSSNMNYTTKKKKQDSSKLNGQKSLAKKYL